MSDALKQCYLNNNICKIINNACEFLFTFWMCNMPLQIFNLESVVQGGKIMYMYIYKILLVLFFFYCCYYLKKTNLKEMYLTLCNIFTKPFWSPSIVFKCSGGVKKEIFMLLASIYCIMKKNPLCVSSLNRLLLVWNVNQSDEW